MAVLRDLPLILILLLSWMSSVLCNFTYTYNAPTQCGQFTVNWTGGQAPYQLQLLPLFGTQRIFTIPSSSYSNGKGSYSVTLPFNSTKQFVAVMSDSTGFASGGVSVLNTVGAAQNGANCNTVDPGVDFYYATNSALQQCGNYPITNYTGAVQPVTLYALIPGGQALTLLPSMGSTEFDWVANIASGVQLVFSMVDSKGNLGGVSDVTAVGASDNTACLNSKSPSSTSNPPTTATSTSSQASSTSSAPSATSSSSSGGSSNGISLGAIVATVAGAVVAIAVLVSLLLFFLRRKRVDHHDEEYWRRRSRHFAPFDADASRTSLGGRTAPSVMTAAAAAAAPSSGHRPRQSSNVFPLNPEHADEGSMAGSAVHLADQQYQPSPFMLPSATHDAYRDDEYDDPLTPRTHRPHLSMHSSARSRKAAEAAAAASTAGSSASRPSRFILHTDAGTSILDQPEEEEVVELPPMYDAAMYSNKHRHPSDVSGETSGAATFGGGPGSNMDLPLLQATHSHSSNEEPHH